VAKVHGHLSAGDAGELVGVTGNTIGQWARWGYIRASQSSGDPHVYSVEDVAEAAVVRALLDRKVRHRNRMVRRAIAHLAEYGDWPLSEAPLAVADGRLVLNERDGAFALSPRGWQRMCAPPPLEDVRLRLRRS